MKGIKNILFFFCAIAIVCACENEDFPEISSSSDSALVTAPTREVSEENRTVMLLYSCGFNSLSNYLLSDIAELEQGHIPTWKRSDDVLLVFSRHMDSRSDSYNEMSPVLFRIYEDFRGEIVRDTLKVWPRETKAADAETMKDVLLEVKDRFPAAGYRMIFSSHGSGWLPKGYYNKPSDYEAGTYSQRKALPYFDESELPWNAPGQVPVKSIGQDICRSSDALFEMTMAEFASALPYKLDFLLFDACLMGGIEVAWELRDKVSLLAFSQAEVIADGFEYSSLAAHILKHGQVDAETICREYYEYYASQPTSDYRSATISAIDCDRLEPLADVCRKLFEKYRYSLNSLDYYRVQGFYRYSRHFFFDLRDILVQAGASASDLADLDAALSECVIYKAATPSFLNSFDIRAFCGLSMYLPSGGTARLNEFYRSEIGWNAASGLVE